MKIQFLLFVSLLTVVACQQKAVSQQNTKEMLTHDAIKVETDKIFNKLVDIRKQLHKNPELAGKEVETRNVVKQYLLDLGLEVKTNTYGYGLVGILKGEKKGKNIAWRADMDALPNDFSDREVFKSTVKGVQHGCGHDVHMTIALGIAEVLSKNKKDLQGTVYFIFQPEEESFNGAKKMVANGLLTDLNLNEIYGLHVTPFPLGQIMVKANEMFAYQKGVRMAFKNNLSAEDILQFKMVLQNTLTRTKNGSKPWDIQQALDPNIGLANANTIFTDYFIMDGNFVNYTKSDTFFLEMDMYETDADKLKNIIPKIKQAIQAEKFASQLLSVSFFKENPTIMNDPKLTEAAVTILDNRFGKGSVTLNYGQIPFSNDDFSYFQQKVPGVYFFFGASNFEKGIIAMIHAPDFAVDEECIRIGVKSFSSLIFERLKNAR